MRQGVGTLSLAAPGGNSLRRPFYSDPMSALPTVLLEPEGFPAERLAEATAKKSLSCQ